MLAYVFVTEVVILVAGNMNLSERTDRIGTTCSMLYLETQLLRISSHVDSVIGNV